MPHYQTLNPNRESDRAKFASLSAVHWTKPVSSLTEHHAMAGSSKIKLGKGASASGGASTSSTSASTSTSKGTFTVHGKISVF